MLIASPAVVCGVRTPRSSVGGPVGAIRSVRRVRVRIPVEVIATGSAPKWIYVQVGNQACPSREEPGSAAGNDPFLRAVCSWLPALRFLHPAMRLFDTMTRTERELRPSMAPRFVSTAADRRFTARRTSGISARLCSKTCSAAPWKPAGCARSTSGTSPTWTTKRSGIRKKPGSRSRRSPPDGPKNSTRIAKNSACSRRTSSPARSITSRSRSR